MPAPTISVIIATGAYGENPTTSSAKHASIAAALFGPTAAMITLFITWLVTILFIAARIPFFFLFFLLLFFFFFLPKKCPKNFPKKKCPKKFHPGFFDFVAPFFFKFSCC